MRRCRQVVGSESLGLSGIRREETAAVQASRGRRREHPSDDPFKMSKIDADYPKRKNDLVRSNFIIRPDGFGGHVARHVGAARLAGGAGFSQRNFVRSAFTSPLTNPKCSKRSTIELLLFDRTSVIIGATHNDRQRAARTNS